MMPNWLLVPDCWEAHEDEFLEVQLYELEEEEDIPWVA